MERGAGPRKMGLAFLRFLAWLKFVEWEMVKPKTEDLGDFTFFKKASLDLGPWLAGL